MKFYKVLIALLLLFSLVIAGCSPAQTATPTAIPTDTPTEVPTNTPLPTETATPIPTDTPTLEPTFTSTPEPVCMANNSIVGSPDETIPGYMDIVSVSSTLEGTKLTAVFTMREIPDEISIDREIVNQGTPEIAWGIDIDTDNNEDTGGHNFLFGTGYGYDTTLQAFSFKQGAERSGTIEKLFKGKTLIWKITEKGISSGANGKIVVDPAAKTITLSATIQGITPELNLHYFTYFNNGDGEDPSIDELCDR